jgi:hypothetical protein
MNHTCSLCGETWHEDLVVKMQNWRINNLINGAGCPSCFANGFTEKLDQNKPYYHELCKCANCEESIKVSPDAIFRAGNGLIHRYAGVDILIDLKNFEFRKHIISIFGWRNGKENELVCRLCYEAHSCDECGDYVNDEDVIEGVNGERCCSEACADLTADDWEEK